MVVMLQCNAYYAARFSEACLSLKKESIHSLADEIHSSQVKSPFVK